MGKNSRTHSPRDWRMALELLREELPAIAHPAPFDFTDDREWDRAVRFAHDVLRRPGTQFPPGSSNNSRSSLAFALQWGTANAVPGLAPICEGLTRLGGAAARKFDVERAVRFAASYLLNLGDRKVVEDFVCQDYGSIQAATAFLMHLDEDAITRLRVPLLQKLSRDISPTVMAKVVERVSRIDANGCATALNALEDERRAVVWRSISKRTQRHLREACSVELRGVALVDREAIETHASTLSADEVRRLLPSGVEFGMLHWLAKHGGDDVRDIAAEKIRIHRERGRQPHRPPARTRVDTRQPLHRLAASWRAEDRWYVVDEAPLKEKNIPLLCTLILDADAAIARRALERLAQLSPARARQHVAANPRALSPRALRWLATDATSAELAALLAALSSAKMTIPVDAVLMLLGSGFDPLLLAEHLGREANGSGLGVLAAFYVHRGNVAGLAMVADLATTHVPLADRHDVVRTALSHSFRAWRYANDVGAALSALTAALADTEYRNAYKHSLNVLGELNTALSFPRIRLLREALEDVFTLCTRRFPRLSLSTDAEGYIIERGDDFVGHAEAWVVENLGAFEGEAILQLGYSDDGRCTLSCLEADGDVLGVHAYLPWQSPPSGLDELSVALGHPQPDRLRDYVPLMHKVTNITRNMSATELAWALVRTSTHDADYLEKELSRLALWVHSLKNSLRAFANADRPSPAARAAVERYRREAQRLLGVFGFHESIEDELFDVRLLCDEVLASQRSIAGRRGVTMSCSAPEGLVVLGPARHLDRILSNFVANAVDAVGEQGKICVSATFDRSRCELSIEVADDGPGIPVDCLNQLFMITKSDKHDEEHFGMGLFEARQLALDVGGAISVEALQLGGTLATVTVPVESGSE